MTCEGRRRFSFASLAAALAALAFVASAGAADGYTIRPVPGGGGLDNPRGIALGSGGRIIVAEAGRGPAKSLFR